MLRSTKNWVFTLCIVFLFSLMSLGCGSESEVEYRTLEQPWSSDGGEGLNVHRNLTINARDWVLAKTGTFFCRMLWHGNEDTDWKDDCLQDFVDDIGAYPELTLGSPEMHFMRDSQHAIYNWRSSRDACEIAKDEILRATLEAFRIYDRYYDTFEKFKSTHPHCYSNYKDPDDIRYEMFSYILGHALHIIQDSTSYHHARRYGSGYKKLNQVCTGRGDSNAHGCRHAEYSLEQCTTDFEVALCHAAEDASKGYLYTISNLISGDHSDHVVLTQLERWETDSNVLYGGYFDCSTARDDDDYYVWPNPIPSYYFKKDEIRARLIPILYILV